MRKRNRRIIITHLTRSIRILARKRNAVINIENAICAAGTPDGGGGLHRVLLCVDEAVGEGATARDRHACGLRFARVLAEVVGRDEGAVYAVVEARPPVVSGVDHGVLETAGVAQVQVDLAVFGAV